MTYDNIKEMYCVIVREGSGLKYMFGGDSFYATNKWGDAWRLCHSQDQWESIWSYRDLCASWPCLRWERPDD